MATEYGDEAAVAVQFVYARLRDNTQGWPLEPMPVGERTAYPCVGFMVVPGGSGPREPGGEFLWVQLTVRVLAIGKSQVNDMEALRAMAKEITTNLTTNSSQPGTKFGNAQVISCVRAAPQTGSDRDEQGNLRWYHGFDWQVRVQGDAAG